MRIITTFNESLYQETGKELLASIGRQISDCEILVYAEDLASTLPAGMQVIEVSTLPEVEELLRSAADVIPVDMGGTATGLSGYNQRWFNWFRKVVVQHDAIVRRPVEGITLFLDSDVRAVRQFCDADVSAFLKKSVGVLLGDRESIESGVVAYRGNAPQARQFVCAFMEMFRSGRFRELKRWDDGYVMKICADENPQLVQDFAADKKAAVHKNTNGHETSGQLLPQTFLGQYLEHDKGLHWRRKAAVPVAQIPGSHTRAFYDWLLRVVSGR